MYYPYIPERHNRSSRKITVTGHGQVAVEPDVATVQIEVSTVNKQVSVAQEQNAQIMNQVIQSMLQLGVPRENIRTVSYTVSPQYDYVDGKQIFRGYEVNNSISVKLTDIQQVGTVIDTAVANGANQISNIQFSVEDESVYKQQAIDNALKDAQLKATTIAKSLQLVMQPQPIKVTELDAVANPVRYKSVAMSDMSSTPIEQGQIIIAAAMSVQYSF
ncbi:SIMPL domain-containing protein [Sporosarcina sp. Sa2YVA2]|uniref:SIMPL domain-containing protein n=1 Tax=Sporosarcina quadrami TaxID=2762234 RepID=A0ABR8UDU3_9BACL|nr:SIMPL domain-containing protein [Sporosarcina quadrami]MBD7985995.1 SIMPL domain-containing protein [Sporosarcina quadrami]